MTIRTLDPTTLKDEDLLTPGEVAFLFRVDPKTVSRWCKNNRIPSITTPGGHHRIAFAYLRPLLAIHKK
jgi:excisionase family DNA binding protein